MATVFTLWLMAIDIYEIDTRNGSAPAVPASGRRGAAALDRALFRLGQARPARLDDRRIEPCATVRMQGTSSTVADLPLGGSFSCPSVIRMRSG